MSSELRTERREHCLVLTISDPGARNALSPQISAAAVEALGVAEGDPEIRSVVLTGDGAHFSAGGNLQRLTRNRELGPDTQRRSIDALHQFVEALRAFPKPVIAAVEGAAAGAGFSLVLACDLAVAAEDARFSMAYGRVGLSPDGGGSWQLARALPRPLVMQSILFGETLTAQQLLAFGLVNEVTAPGQALAHALASAARIAQCAPNAVASAKELVNRARDGGLTDHLALERSHFVENLFHANAGEGLRAFFDKRAPNFR
ncbi:oxepin-CoA hydrolase, alternative type [Rivibacter subsaxonicus]|uniref:Enoyl-CoA hydratase/carnithine racemase n=1 Tax=Rivibacter subsaxonicus TaxID=457575 RepID=A0A4Q7VEZ8_9BURK|nr:enoyl-CoA hydratase [Rivibacter subsaxonicus]RZT93872.1 enoyl-CoA hydratase/carnithine racemase [Rivibacter subsaxonicus]